jgi:hypothetical protein
MSSDLHLLSFPVTCLFKKREKEKKKSPLDGAPWIAFRCPLIFWLGPSSPIFIVFHRPTVRHSKRDYYIWEMEIRQGYYVWGLFSQNRVWHGAPAWKFFNGRFHQLCLFSPPTSSYATLKHTPRSFPSFHFRFFFLTRFVSSASSFRLLWRKYK